MQSNKKIAKEFVFGVGHTGYNHFCVSYVSGVCVLVVTFQENAQVLV